jgi:hypothetical protein
LPGPLSPEAPRVYPLRVSTNKRPNMLMTTLFLAANVAAIALTVYVNPRDLRK